MGRQGCDKVFFYFFQKTLNGAGFADVTFGSSSEQYSCGIWMIGWARLPW